MNESGDGGLVLVEWNNKVHGGHVNDAIKGVTGVAADHTSTAAWSSLFSSVGSTLITVCTGVSVKCAAAGYALSIAGSVLGISSGPSEGEILNQKLEDVLENQEAMRNMLEDLAKGQAKMMNFIKVKAAESELRGILKSNSWMGVSGSDSVYDKYEELVEDIHHYLDSGYSLETTVYKVGEKAEKSLSYAHFESSLGERNVIAMLKYIKEIKGKDSIGRWTAAEFYRDYLVLRTQLFALLSYARMYEDGKELEVPKWDQVEQEAIVKEYARDLSRTNEWANSKEGFLYPKGPDAMKNC